MRHRSALLLLVPLVFAGCGGGGGGSAAPALASAPLGALGGQNIGLTVTPAGAQVQFACGGSGTISRPLLLDAGGGFDVPGTVSPAQGPPRAPILPPPTPIPARYSGTTDGKTLRLTVTPSDAGLAPGTYTLVYGAAPTFSQPCPN